MTAKVDIKATQACQREMTFSIPADVLARELDAVYASLGKNRRVPGFRPGKAPRSILERHFAAEARAEVIKNQIGSSYNRAIGENKLEVVGDPLFSAIQWEEGGSLTFKATVDIRPVIEPCNYRDVHLTRSKPRVEEKEVEAVIESFRQRSAVFEAIGDRPLEPGDWGLVDYREVKVPPLKWMENRLLEIKPDAGGNVSAQLVSMRPGETRLVKSKELSSDAGAVPTYREIELEVKLKEIKKRNLPEVTDELARSWGQYSSLDEVKSKVRESIRQRKEEETRRDLENQVINALLSKNQLPLPPAVLKTLEEDYFHDFARRRDSAEPGAGTSRPTDEELKKAAAEAAEKDLRLIFLLDEIARREKITVDPKDLGEEVSRIARWQGQEVSSYRQELEKSGQIYALESRLSRRRVMDFIIKEAKIKDREA